MVLSLSTNKYKFLQNVLCARFGFKWSVWKFSLFCRFWLTHSVYLLYCTFNMIVCKFSCITFSKPHNHINRTKAWFHFAKLWVHSMLGCHYSSAVVVSFGYWRGNLFEVRFAAMDDITTFVKISLPMFVFWQGNCCVWWLQPWIMFGAGICCLHSK